MKRVRVRSSNLRSVGWQGGKLQIEFTTGAIYDYAGVPETVFKALLSAESVGAFFYHSIRDKYPVSKVPIEILRREMKDMAVTDGANRNPNAATAGQPTGATEAGTQGAKKNKGGVAGAGAAPAGPSKTGPQDAGTAAAMKRKK